MYKTIQHQTLVISACTKCANQENVTKTEEYQKIETDESRLLLKKNMWNNMKYCIQNLQCIQWFNLKILLISC